MYLALVSLTSLYAEYGPIDLQNKLLLLLFTNLPVKYLKHCCVLYACFQLLPSMQCSTLVKKSDPSPYCVHGFHVKPIIRNQSIYRFIKGFGGFPSKMLRRMPLDYLTGNKMWNKYGGWWSQNWNCRKRKSTLQL